MACLLPQLFCDMWCHRSQQLYHTLQCVLESPATSHFFTLQLDHRVIALHQSSQGGVEAHMTDIFGYSLDSFMTQTLKRFAFAGLGFCGMLNPVFADHAPETIQEAPYTFQVLGLKGTSLIKGTHEHHIAANCIRAIFSNV